MAGQLLCTYLGHFSTDFHCLFLFSRKLTLIKIFKPFRKLIQKRRFSAVNFVDKVAQTLLDCGSAGKAEESNLKCIRPSGVVHGSSNLFLFSKRTSFCSSSGDTLGVLSLILLYCFLYSLRCMVWIGWWAHILDL